MNPFMGNSCMYGYCHRTDCEKCSYYSPTIFGIRVPRWLGNFGFWVEYQIDKHKNKGKF